MDKREERIEEILEDYKHASGKRRINMWLMFFELREEFDELERYNNPPDPAFGVNYCTTCCK